MSQIGRIGGPVLSADLLRDGSDLAFETDLLYLSVADLSNPLKTVGLGINNNSPSQKLQITGTSHFAKSDPLFPTDWIIDTQADLADLSFLTYKIQNTVGGTGGRIFIQPDQSVDPKIVTNEIRTAKLKLVNSSISTLLTDDNIEITANGLGQTQFYTTTVNINGNLAVTGNLQWDGNTITIGSDDTDRVIFNADINSNILPDVNNLYTLGSTTKKWNTVYSTNINTLTLEAAALTLNGIDMLLPQGNTIYVSVNGNDTNNGVHLHNTYRTVKHALSQAVAGDNIVVFPGTYIEDFPLTVPQGVSVTGTGIRAVTIYPSSGTNSNDAFLLNGETTVSHLTVGSFFYNSVNDTGYGFRLAPNCLVTTRSPYVQNISILNKGTAIDLRDTIDGGASATIIFDLILDGGEALPGYIDSINGGFANIDPTLGFASGDAGRGALVDGSTVHPDSKEASILFHSVTFIVPNANGVTATNGARVEWLNSFTYFANRGIYLTEGTAGFASLNIRFGAEFRSIGSANVYGTFGAVADGASTLGYLVGHNFAYIGTGADSQNDYDLVIQANEVVAINGGQLYYDSMDHKGDYRIGDIFYVNQQTGAITFNAQALDFSAGGSIVLEGASGRTEINAQLISTGNIVIHDNNIDSVLGPVNFLAQTGVTTLNTDVTVTGSLGVSGDVLVKGNVYLGNDPLDTVSVIPLLTQTIKPNLHNTFTLGTGGVTPKVWNTAYLTSVNVDNVTQLASNTITTLTTDTNLQLVASGTGVISAPLKSVDITNNLQVTGTTTVNGITSLKNVEIGEIVPLTAVQTLNNPNAYGTASFDNFGHAVAISGNYAIVGVYAERDAGGPFSGKAYIFNVTTGALVHTLDNPNAFGLSRFDNFGYSVAISDTYTIVGAPREGDAGDTNGSGKAYIYNVTTGALVHTLDNPNAYGTSAGDQFGNSVAISGNYAIVGAFQEDDASGSLSGKAYIYNVTTGALVHTLNNPNSYSTSVGDQFGQSVAISGNYAIVGAWAEDDAGGIDSGKAYIYNVTTGALVHTLDNPNAYSTSASDQFGLSTSISGNYAIVGARNEGDAGGTTSGKAYIFNVTTGALVHTLNNPNAYGTSAGDQFGESVAISGDYAVVGVADEDDVGGTTSGKAYIFNVTTGALVHTLNNPNAYGTSAGDNFGCAVAISGDYAIIGAVTEDDAAGGASGKAYIFGDLLNNKTLTQTGNFLQTGSTSITGNITSVNNITGYDYLQSSRIQISGNYISAIDLDADINFTAGGSNGVILDSRLKITDNTISNVWSGATTNAQKSIYFTPNGTGNVVINSTKAIQLPTSNDLNRVLTDLGEVRLNSTTLVFEGKIAGGIIPLKGIYDSDRNTYITPELTVGANDNTLRFFNNGTLTTRINTTALLNNLIHIDNIQLSGNTVNNRITGDDLIFAPNTTGAINLNNLSFPENTIRNNTNGALTFNSTGVGYVKFGGTYGVVIPTGTGNPAYAPGTPQNQRPVTAEIGEVRHNTSLNYMEVYNGTIWIPAVGTLGAAPLGEVLDIMDFWSLILG